MISTVHIYRRPLLYQNLLLRRSTVENLYICLCLLAIIRPIHYSPGSNPHHAPGPSVPLASSARHAARHTLSGLQRVGQAFLAGVRPDSPSKSGTYLLAAACGREVHSCQ